MRTEAAATSGAVRGYRYYDLLLGAFVAVLLCSNLIGAGKTVGLEVPLWGWVSFGAANLFFPLAYIFGDIFTEVYGYARARRAIWAGFGAMAFASLMGMLVIALPADPAEPFNRTLQPALETVFGNAPRIAVASLVAYCIGDFVNSFLLAKMKVLTQGRHLWSRTIGSTVVGQLVDSVIFYPLAFAGIWATDTLLRVVIFNWLFKIAVEALFTPLTYWVVNRVKRAEGEDFYDVGTRFTPFSLGDK